MRRQIRSCEVQQFRRSDRSETNRVTSHPPRRLLLLCALAAGLGLAAGATAWVLIKLIAILTNLALFHRWGTTLPNFADLADRPVGRDHGHGRRDVVTLLARWSPIIRGHGIPEAMDAVLTRRSKVAPSTAVAKPRLRRGRHRHRRAVRRRGPDHRHRRRPRLARRPGPPRLGQRAQDPAGLRGRGRHGRHLRHPARRGGAGHRAAAVRVLAAGLHPARRVDERRRRRPRRAVRRRAAVRRARPRVQRPRPAPAVRAARRAAAACSRCSSPEGCSPSRACSADCPSARPGTRSSAPPCGPRSACSCRARSASATTSSTTRSPAAWPSPPSPTLAIGKLVIWWIALASGTSGGTLAPILLISSCFGALRRRACSPRLPGPRHLTVGLRARGHGGHVRRRRPRPVRRDRVPVRADPRLQRHPPADAGHRARRPRRPHARCPTAS